MKEFFKEFLLFWRSVYSEPDGSGSSSRILTFILALVASTILVIITLHLIHITDVALLTAWLASLPLIIAALVAFFTAPYGVNKGSGSFTDIVSILKGKDRDKQ